MRLPLVSTPASKLSSNLLPRRKPARHGALKDCATRIEALESRIALSVTIKAANGDIFVSGDNTANHVTLFQDGGGNLFIYGDTNTAIAGEGVVSATVPDTNAGGGREFNSGLFKNLYVSMGSDDDTVEVAGLRAADVASVTINTGGATTGDTVVFSSTTFVGIPDTSWGPSAVAGPVTILTGNGANTVTLHDLTANSLNVATGSGNDTINLGTTAGLAIHGDATIDAGDGSNTINTGMTDSNVTTVDGQFHLRTGGGNDTITLDSISAGSLVVDTGAGTDAINIAINHAALINGDASLHSDAGIKTITIGAGGNTTVVKGNLDIVSGGPSSVALNYLTVGNGPASLRISTGAGDDSITLGSTGAVSVVAGSLLIDTGDATLGDTLSIGSGQSVSVSDNLTIHSGSGADSVALDSLTAGSLNVDTGSGIDGINLAQSGAVTIHGDAFLQADTGNKTILVGSTSHPTAIDGNLDITLGTGNDSVTLDFLTVGNVKGSLNISTGLGDDVVKVASAGDVSVPHGSVTIDTGDASTIDSVTLGSANHAVTISGDLAIHTGSGDDAVILDSLTVGSTLGFLTINTGTGDDTITLAANGNLTVAHGSVSIDTGDSVSDAVLIGGAHSVTISGDLSIHTGDGNDTVTIDQLTCTNLDIHTSGGSDTVTVAGTDSVTINGNATIDTGDVTTGGDIVHIGGGAAVSVGKTLAVTLGSGDDTFSLDHVNSAGAVSVNGGSGNNTINLGSIAAVAVANLLSIQTGTGNDSVNTSSVTAGSLTVDTGLGVDAASLQHLTVAGIASILVADHDHTLTLASQAISDVTITAGASHATISLGAGSHITKAFSTNRRDFHIKHLPDAIGITFKPHAAGSRDTTLRITDHSDPHHKVKFQLDGYSPVSIDLAPTIKKIKLPKTPIVAGSNKKIKVPIAIANAGNTAVPHGSKVDVEIYVHNTGTNVDTLITTLSRLSVSALAAGKSKVLRHAIKMPGSLAAGLYEVMVKIVDDSPFLETSILNNSATSTQTFQVTA